MHVSRTMVAAQRADGSVMPVLFRFVEP